MLTFVGLSLNARPSLRTKLPNNVFEVTSSYEMTRMGIARSIPVGSYASFNSHKLAHVAQRFEVFKETLAVENVDEPVSIQSQLRSSLRR